MTAPETALRAKIEAALKEAYQHGYRDGERYGYGGRMSPKLWRESVTFARRVDTINGLFALHSRTTPAAMTPEVRALVEAFNWQTKARAQHWLRRNMSAPEDAEVKSLCEKYGYGAVMDAASRLWARGPYGSGAFYVGGCIGFKSDEEALAALRAGGDA